MPRGKKQTEVEEVLDVVDEELDEALDANETPDEEEAGEQTPAPKRSRAKRAPRKRKEPAGPVAALFQAASEGPAAKKADKDAEAEDEDEETDETGTSDDDEAATAKADEAKVEEEKPARQRRPRATAEEKALSGAMETAMESMVKHWSAAKDISTTMATNMEKVTTLVQELPAKYDGKLEEIFKQPAPKPTLVTKIAVGMSAAALILSLVALQLAQAVRTHVITAEASRVAAPQAVPQAAPQAPQLARREREAPVSGLPGPRITPRPLRRAAPTVRSSTRR